MGRIPQQTIDEILSKTDIESLIGEYVSFTKKTGQNLFGLCPFHSEKTPSFSVSPSKGIYKCFGCDRSGNAISFIMEMDNCNFQEAVKKLGDRCGVPVQADDDDWAPNDEIRQAKKRVRSILTSAAGFYYKAFKDPKVGKQAREYAASRQLSEETLTKFGIGFAPDGFDNLYKYLSKKGYSDDDLMNSGLFVRSKRGNIIDLFRKRLMVPIFDFKGQIVAFGGRNLGTELPKYVNSPDSLVYKKQEHLYALNFARQSKTRQLIIVEGYMDAIAMHQAGINNAVAALGTSFTDKQLRLASKYADEIVFFFDSDTAGRNAALRATNMMLTYLRRFTGMKIRIKIARVPDGKDPDEYIKTYGAESFKSVVRSAQDVNDYLFSRAYDDNYTDDGGLDLTGFQDDIVKYGSWISDGIKREKMATEASRYLGARTETIIASMEHAESDNIDAAAKSEMRDAKREEQQQIDSRAEERKDLSAGDDVVSREELELFVRAVRLKGVIADQSKVDRADVLRKGDFTGKNMKELVSFFLENFGAEGVSDAVLVSKLQELIFNGQRAESVYLNACDSIREEDNEQSAIDMYKKCLYGIRLKRCEDELNLLAPAIRAATDKDQKEELMNKMAKLEYLRDLLIKKDSEI